MKIQIFATSDVHGYIMPTRYSDRKLDSIGLTRIQSIIEKHRDANTLLIDNGDVLQGSPLNYFHSLFKENEVHPMAKAMLNMKYDYYNVGNHDFNFGKDALKNFIEDCGASCITGNIISEEIGLKKGYTIHRFDDEHAIALIGVATQYIPNWEIPEHIENVEFINAFDTVKEIVPFIKKNEDVQGIVVCYHGGFEKDLVTGEATEPLTGENLAYKMCAEIEGIDLLITGHQHRSIAGTCCGVATTQTGCNAKEVAQIVWDLDTKQIDTKLIPVTDEYNMSIAEDIMDEENQCQIWLDQPLGSLASGDLLVHDEFDARLHKHPVISFLNQVALDLSKAQISSMALFSGAKGFESKITMRDLVSTYLYPNTTIIKRMSAAQLKLYLEKAAEYFSVKDGEIIVTPSYVEPKPQHFNYDMVDGIEYTIVVNRPVGSRVTNILYKGEPINESDTFTFAMSNYRAAGGGNYYIVNECETIREIQTDMVEALAKYIKKNDPVVIEHHDNIHIIIE